MSAVARRRDLLASLVEEMGGSGAGHSMFVADVSNRSEIKALATFVESTYGRVDVLVNNRASQTSGTSTSPGAVEAIEAVMATTFFGRPSLHRRAASPPGRLRSGERRQRRLGGRTNRGGWGSLLSASSSRSPAGRRPCARLLGRGVVVSVVDPGPVPTEGFPQGWRSPIPFSDTPSPLPEDVSKAIRDAIEHGRSQRTVPRWYYLLQFPRLLFTPSIDRWTRAESPLAESAPSTDSVGAAAQHGRGPSCPKASIFIGATPE